MKRWKETHGLCILPTLLLTKNYYVNFEMFYLKFSTSTIAGIGRRGTMHFSRHIELYLYNAKLNQASRKPQNPPLATVKTCFRISSTGWKLFSASTTDRENYLSQSPVVNFGVFYWFDLVWHCTNKLRCVLKNITQIIFFYRCNREMIILAC